jgi:endonuclease G
MLSTSARLGFVASLLSLAACGADANPEEQNSTASSIEGTDPLAGTDELRKTATTPGLQLSVHTTLGIPEAATPTDPVHALINHTQYVTSYDSTKKNPRWTSWELTTAWLGSASRSSNFISDHDLAAGIPQSSNSDYSGSGYQRGHICPSADRTKNATDNQQTFLFTNIVPQTAESNTQVWESLETEERNLAKTNHLFIIAGNIYEGSAQTIGNGVAIPSSMFKVVVVMSGAHPAPTDVTTSTRVITVNIPNTTSVSGNYRSYRTSMADIESKTGFTFMSDVSKSIHDALASQVDTQ